MTHRGSVSTGKRVKVGIKDSEGRYCAVDAHGDIDLYSEPGWTNVKIINLPQKNQKQIQGLNLNCLLRGLFILYGFENVDDNTLPGGFYCWEVLLESFFISITHICTIEEVIRRVEYLVELFLHDEAAGNSVEGDNYAVGNVLYGAFSFLMYWLASFNPYLSDTDVTKLKNGISRLGYQLNEPEEEINKKNRYSYNYTEVLEKCRRRYSQLQKIAHEVVHTRLFNTIGLTRTVAAAGAGNQTSTVTIAHHNYAQPNVPGAVGAWTGYEAQVNKEKLKETLANAPKLKIEIFGGDALLDCSDEDDDVGSSPFGSNTQSSFNTSSETAALPPAPVVRVPPGYSLLREPYAQSTEIFQVDPLELARQWTLADHALFRSIPLHSLLPPPGSNASISSYTRTQQVRLGTLGTGAFSGARAFIDRYCAMTNWVVYSVLNNAAMDARAAKLTYFIKIAGHLAELSNFHALMSILSGLSQGSVSRLKYSWENVSKTDKAKLAQLQKLMSGLKNYQKYRLEIAKLSMHFQFADDAGKYAHIMQDNVTQPHHRSFHNNNNNSGGEMVWKRDIVMRYRPSASTAGNSLQRPPPPSTTSNSNPNGGASVLMRSASMNNMMMTKSHSLDNAETFYSDKFEAVVPHLGAHLAELTSIADGNTDYLTDRPYLFNTHKLALLAGTLSLLLKMQRLDYNLTPVRCISAALNFTAKTQLKLSGSAASDFSKKMYALSSAVEPANVDPSENNSVSTTGGPPSLLRQQTAKGKASGSASSAGSPAGQKTRKSLAYERITKSGKLNEVSDEDEEEGSEGDEDGSEEEEEVEVTTPKPKVLRPAKLMRKMTSVFFSTNSNK